MKCPDCGLEVRSRGIKVHRERHVKKLNATKRHKCEFESCNFSTNRKSVLDKHALVHDAAHQLAKIRRRKEKKKLSKLKSNATSLPATTSEKTLEERSTQTDVFAGRDESNETSLRDVRTKINVLKQILNIHYSLLAGSPSEEHVTYYKIFKQMVNPFEEIFHLLKSMLEDHPIDDHVIKVAKEFQEMVSEMTRK